MAHWPTHIYIYTIGHIRPGTLKRPQWATRILYAHVSIYAHAVHNLNLPVYITHVSALVGIESPSSVYTDGTK